MVLIKIKKDSKNGKKGGEGEGNEIKLVPVGFVPLHCFCIMLPIPLLCLSPVVQSLMIKHRVMLPLYRLFYLQYLLCFFALSQKMIYTTVL